MTDATMIAGAISSLKTAAEIAKVLYTAKLDADTKEKISQLQQLVWDARESAYNAQDELAEVKKRHAEAEQAVMDFMKWGKDKERYRLFQPQGLNSVVYGVKESSADGEPPHYICTNCYQESRKSILHNKQSKEQRTAFHCPKCNCSIPTGYNGSVPAVYAPD